VTVAADIGAGARDVRIESNHFSGWDVAISLARDAEVKIKGNTFDDVGVAVERRRTN